MNSLACKILWWQGVVLAALTLARHIAWIAGLGREHIIIGLHTACCLAFAALSMALSRTRVCGLSPWLAVISSFALGIGSLIMGFLAPGASPLVSLVGSELAFVALAIMTAGVMDCKQETGGRMDKPLRVASLLLAMYVSARVLMRIMTMTWFSVSSGGLIAKPVYEILLLFLSAAGVMLSLRTRWPKDNTALSSVGAVAFIVGAILFAGSASSWFAYGSSGNNILGTVLGVALLLTSFLRRFSSQCP